MSIPVLIEVYDEMRRLAIAGSAVAPGDFRLKKLIAPLEKSGEKAPVFAKVAQAAQAVVDSNEKTASTALLDLTTLVNAILYTQGETGAAGDLKALETTDLGQDSTQASARILKPLLEALSSTGSGRMELIRDAFERGTFKDLRLVKPALKGLDDPYSEIADYIAERILPLYGKAIVPELRATLDLKGRGGHVHRLHLLHQLDPEGSRELIQSALNESSKELRVAAVECLTTSGQDLVYLLEQTRSKAKDVRAAALRALTTAGTSSAEVVKALKQAIVGADLELIVPRVTQCVLPEIQDYVIEQAEQQFTEALKSNDKAKQGTAIAKLQQLLSCLEERTDAKAETFVLKCFDSAPAFIPIKSEPSGADLNEFVAHVMSHGTPKMQKKLVASHQTLSGGSLSPALFAARAMMAPAEFYKEFGSLLADLPEKRERKNSAAQERAKALTVVLIWNGHEFLYRYSMAGVSHYGRKAAKSLPPLDPRWLDAAIEGGSVELVCKLARAGHAGVNRFLSAQLSDSKKAYQVQEVLRTMVRVGHPDATDVLIDAIKKLATESTHYYMGYWYGPMIAELPKSALPKFEELLPTLPDKMVTQLMDAVLALKNKSE